MEAMMAMMGTAEKGWQKWQRESTPRVVKIERHGSTQGAVKIKMARVDTESSDDHTACPEGGTRCRSRWWYAPGWAAVTSWSSIPAIQRSRMA
jgi:hypothetical protein